MARKIKLKYWINYALIGALLLVCLLLDLCGALRGSVANMVTQIAYSIVLAISLNLVVGFLGELSLGHAGFMCVGAYIGCVCANALYAASSNAVLSLLLSMLVGGLAAALAGCIIGIPTLRLKGDYLAIVTLAFGEIARNLLGNLFPSVFGGPSGLSTHKFGDKLYIVALITALFCAFVIQNLMRSKHGRAIQAVRDNEIAARASGVNVTYYKLVAFILAAFFAGVVGVIYGQKVGSIRPSTFSFDYSIDILVMVVLGGMGNITGSILAAAALTFLDIRLADLLSGDLAALKNMVYALILIVLVIWNNAPALKHLREKYSLSALWRRLVHRLSHKNPPQDGGEEGPETVAWDKIPTKIPMDAILSTDLSPNDAFEADAPGKEDQP